MSFKELLRWFGVLPIAILAATLVLFPSHWILVMKFGVDSGWGRFLEQLIAPFLSAWAFVAAGSGIAPKYKLKTSYLLAALWICLTVGIFIYIMGNEIGEPKYYGLSSIGGIAGSIVGAWKVKEQLSSESNL